jgi:ATP-dependent Clp protease ATP-binding subunit ClpC
VFEKFTARARMAVVAAGEASRTRNHDHIGTEHLLLGLIANAEDPVTETLRACGGEPSVLHASVDDIRPDGQPANREHIPFTPKAKQTLERSLEEAQRHNHHHVDAEHLLWALTQDPDARSTKVLTACGVSAATVWARLETHWQGQ